jgi:CHAD domain-containing protein
MSWKTYLAELKRCRLEFSNEAVHDLRVATRRIMAVLQFLHSLEPRPRLRKLIHTFKEQLDEFDELRDTQVILAEISESLQELPQLQGFQKQQQHFENKLLKRLRKKFRHFESNDLRRRVRKVHETLEKESRAGFETPVLQPVDDAYLSVDQRLSVMDAARPATIHRVRIAFKRFRYMVEIVHPLLAGFPLDQLKRMNEYQSLMGEVQDAEVFMQTLSDYAENASAQDLETVHRYYARRHAEAIAAFVAEKNRLHQFWRALPDQPFPWEKST